MEHLGLKRCRVLTKRASQAMKQGPIVEVPSIFPVMAYGGLWVFTQRFLKLLRIVEFTTGNI